MYRFRFRFYFFHLGFPRAKKNLLLSEVDGSRKSKSIVAGPVGLTCAPREPDR